MKPKLRKFLSSFLALMMVLALFPAQAALAANPIQIKIGSAAVDVKTDNKDVTLVIPVEITGNPGVSSYSMDVNVPEPMEVNAIVDNLNARKYQSYLPEGALGAGAFYGSLNEYDEWEAISENDSFTGGTVKGGANRDNVVFVGVDLRYGDGYLFWIDCTVPKDTPDGIYTITFSEVKFWNDNSADAVPLDYEITAGSGTITVGDVPETYSVTVTNGTADKTEAAEGDDVTVTADAAPSGKIFDKWTSRDISLSSRDAAKNPLTFKMPGKDVTIVATYKDEPKPDEPTEHSVTVNNGTADKTKAVKDDDVTVTADAAPSGKIFDKWTAKGITLSGEDAAKNPLTFKMPDKDVTLTATYIDLPADTTELEAAVEAAEEALTTATVSKDGSDVAEGNSWVTQADRDALKDAIAAAKTVLNNTKAVQDDVDKAAATLNKAIESFEAAKKLGTAEPGTVNTAALEATIEDAKEAADSVKVSKNGSDIAKTQKWVTEATMDALTDAIEAAQAVLDDENADQAAVNKAVVALEKAVESFEAAKKSGNKSSGGGSSVSPTPKTTYQINVSSISNGTVTAAPTSALAGTRVTITARPYDGYTIGSGSVTVMDSNGNRISVTDNGDLTYTFTMPESDVTVSATFTAQVTPPPPPKLKDVSSNAYYYDAVSWAMEQGITAGTSATTFSPDKACTRAEIVTFLWRAAGSPAVNASNPFTDVKMGAYYYEAVLWAVDKGITAGTSATTFSPDKTCTRAEAVTFLYRMKGSPAASGSNNFKDVASSAYYANAVQWAVNVGVAQGTSTTTFTPNQTCTRAEIVTFMYRGR